MEIKKEYNFYCTSILFFYAQESNNYLFLATPSDNTAPNLKIGRSRFPINIITGTINHHNN